MSSSKEIQLSTNKIETNKKTLGLFLNEDVYCYERPLKKNIGEGVSTAFFKPLKSPKMLNAINEKSLNIGIKSIQEKETYSKHSSFLSLDDFGETEEYTHNYNENFFFNDGEEKNDAHHVEQDIKADDPLTLLRAELSEPALPKKQHIEGSMNKSSTPAHKPSKISNHGIADVLMSRHKFAVINQNLHYWEPTLGHFVGLAGDKADLFIRQNVPSNFKGFITSRANMEIIKWLESNKQLLAPEESISRRKSYVSFINGVVDIKDLSLQPHSPTYYFTSVVNAAYQLEPGLDDGINFERFLAQVTGGCKSKYLRLQELFGYILSEIRDVKVIPFLLGPKDSGKSIVLKLLTHLIGDEYSTSLSLEQMNQPDYLCHLFGKKLNACGEISEVPLKKLDTLKKLSGGDVVMARFLYAQAINFVNQAALLFAGNHLPILKGIDRSNAFTERLEVFPFSFQVPKEKQDIHLFEKLIGEKSYIAWWSLKGLQRWVKNNYQFTKSEDVEFILSDYTIRNNSIKNFLNECCKFGPEFKEHNSVLLEAYKDFCNFKGLVAETDKAFHKYMQDVENLEHTRFRNPLNKNGYLGIALKKEV